MDKNSVNLLKSATSLVGIVCKDGVVIAGDRKVTAGNMVLYKRAQKVLQINNYLVVAWTGSVSDAQLFHKLIKAELKLKELNDKRRPNIKECANLIAMIAYKNIRQPSMIPFMTGLLVGGINEDGKAELYSVEPAGGILKINDFDANFSSGMPFILGFLEREWKKDINTKEGVRLAIEAIKSSSERDVASGLGVDVFTITKDGIRHESKQIVEKVYKEQSE